MAYIKIMNRSLKIVALSSIGLFLSITLLLSVIYRDIEFFSVLIFLGLPTYVFVLLALISKISIISRVIIPVCVNFIASIVILEIGSLGENIYLTLWILTLYLTLIFVVCICALLTLIHLLSKNDAFAKFIARLFSFPIHSSEFIVDIPNSKSFYEIPENLSNVRKNSAKYILPMAVILPSLFLGSFAIRYGLLDYYWHLNDYTIIVQTIKSEQLAQERLGLVKLPPQYEYLSEVGAVQVLGSSATLSVIFYEPGFSFFLYTETGSPPERFSNTCSRIYNQKHWFRCSDR